ncbi:MAG: hypothetical protein P9X24_17470 [Candidatus Hatepunaea meridiana]|nr:hypothetical protein [Candidatus Hatepunaea meridiana]
MHLTPIILLSVFLTTSTGAQTVFPTTSTSTQISQEVELLPGEVQYLNNAKRLVPDGEFKNGSLSPDESWICWQAPPEDETGEDQVWVMPAIGGVPLMISSGIGRAINPVFVPGTNLIVYSENITVDPATLSGKDKSAKLLCILDEQDLYMANTEGGKSIRLTDTPGYDSEPSVSPDGQTIVFTSARIGDINLFTMNFDGTNQTPLIKSVGIECQPCFSPDGMRIIFSSYNPQSKEEKAYCKDVINSGKVPFMPFELEVINVDGTNRRKITELGATSLSPCIHLLSGNVVFQSNYSGIIDGENSIVSDFNLFEIGIDGTRLRQITFNPDFDGRPNFSLAGGRLIWTSVRHTTTVNSYGLYSAEWIAVFQPSTIIPSTER